MRWLPTVAFAAAAELLAWSLSLAWGFAVLVMAFVVVSVRASSVMAASAAKTRSTEDRVNAIIPVLGEHLTLINSAQSSANSAQSTANTANSAANDAQGTANSAQSTANNALDTANGAVQKNTDATLTDLTVTGNVTIDGNCTVHGGGNVVTSAGGSLTLGTSGGGSPDGNSGPNWGTGERNYINGLWAAVAGINNFLNNA